MGGSKKVIWSAICAVLLCGVIAVGWIWWRSPAQWRVKKSPDGRMLSGAFTLRVGLPDNPSVLIRYTLPLNEQGKLRKSAEDFLFYAPYNGEAGRIRKSGIPAWVVPMCSEDGFSVFTLTIQATSPTDSRYYIYPKSGWHEVILRIRRLIAEHHGLPLKPMAVTGESSGGSLAEQLLAAHPDKFWGAAWCGGSAYAPLPVSDTEPAILALSTWGCPGEEATARLSTTAPHGHTVLHAETPPKFVGGRHEHHASSPTSQALMRSFLVECRSLRARHGGRLPPLSMWPEHDETTDVRLPGPQTLAQWRALPHEVSRRLKNASDAGPFMYPPPKHPQSVAILCFDGGRAGDFLLRDALALLTQQGCVAVAIRHVDDGGMAEDKLLSLMEILTHHPSYANLPILLFGNGRGVVAARALLLRLPPERLSRSALLAPAELLLKRDASTGREMDFEIERTKGYYPDFDEWRYFLDCARENDEEHP